MRLEDLKRGMRCTTRDDVFIVDRVIIDNAYENSIAYLKLSKNNHIGVTGMNGDLTGDDPVNDILKVEDITMDGYEIIWEYVDKRYYLKLPYKYHRGATLNYIIDEQRYYFGTADESFNYKTEFTLAEIEKLPNQDFINTLEKELVE